MKLETIQGKPAKAKPHNNGCRVLLFGEVLGDVFPERTVLGGAPFNVACHLKAFAQNPVVISRLGNDHLRRDILELMRYRGMATVGMQCCNSHPTGKVLVHMDAHGHRFEILPHQAYDYIHPTMARMTALSVNPALTYFGTLAQRNHVSQRALKFLLRIGNSIRFLDLNLRKPWYDAVTVQSSIVHADILKLNHEELEEVAQMMALPRGSAEHLASELIHRYRLEQVVVTYGEHGSWVARRNQAGITSVDATHVGHPVDTVGAGDGFAAVYILGTLLRWTADVTLARANCFAAAICGIRGAIPEHPDFYDPYIADWAL